MEGSTKSPDNDVGGQQIIHQQVLSLTANSQSKPTPLVNNLGQHKPPKQNHKNDKKNGALLYQNRSSTNVSSTNSCLYCRYGQTSSIPSNGSSLYTPSFAHTIPQNTKPASLQHTQTTQYYTPPHPLNNVTGINSSFNYQYYNVEELHPTSEGVPDSTPDAISAAPPIVYHKDITTAASSAFRTPAIKKNIDRGMHNNSVSSNISQKINTARAALVTPTNDIVNEELDFIMKRWRSFGFDIGTIKAIVARLDDVVNGTDSYNENQLLDLKSHNCTEFYSHQQNDSISCEQLPKVVTKDISLLNEEVDDITTIVYDTSHDDVDEMNITLDEKSTVGLESAIDKEDNGNVDVSTEETTQQLEVVDNAKYERGTIKMDSVDEEMSVIDSNESSERDKSTSNELGRDTQSNTDPLASDVVSYVPLNEEEDNVEEEDDGEVNNQQTGLTVKEVKTLEMMMRLDGIEEWENNIGPVLDCYKSNESKEQLKDKAFGIAKATISPIVKIPIEVKEIGETFASSIDERNLSTTQIGEQLKHHFKGMNKDPDVIKTCLLDNTQSTPTSADSRSPIVFLGGRGSKKTNNTGTTQCRNSLEMALLSVEIGILPQNTRLCTNYYFAHECNKDKIHHAPALWYLLWSIFNVDQDVQVILAMNELKRFGRGQLLNKILLIIELIHPDTKIFSGKEFSMHPNDVTNNNEQDILEYNSITDELGDASGYNNAVPISDEERKRLDRISSLARVIASDYVAMARKGLIPINIRDALERGREVSEDDESDRNDFKLVIDNVHGKVKDEHTPLSDQPEVHSAIKEQLDDLNKQHPIEHHCKDGKAVLLYLRRTKGCNGKSVWDVSLSQLTLDIAAGIVDGCITNDTKLIIISEDDVARTNELNPGFSRAMSRIRARGVSAFIEASTLRGTSHRVVHNTLEEISEEAATKVILAAQSSDSKYIRMMHAEIENKRQLKLAEKTDRFHETDDSIRDKLSDSSSALYRLSVFLSIMSRTRMSTRMSPSDYLFKNELAVAKGQLNCIQFMVDQIVMCAFTPCRIIGFNKDRSKVTIQGKAHPFEVDISRISPLTPKQKENEQVVKQVAEQERLKQETEQERIKRAAKQEQVAEQERLKQEAEQEQIKLNPVSKRQSLLAEKSGAAVEAQPASEGAGRWTSEEHKAFVSAYQMYGKDWKKVAAVVKTRTVVQTRTHAQKYFQALQKATVAAGEQNELAKKKTATTSVMKPPAKKKVWTEDEMKLLCDGQKELGNKVSV